MVHVYLCVYFFPFWFLCSDASETINTPCECCCSGIKDTFLGWAVFVILKPNQNHPIGQKSEFT